MSASSVLKVIKDKEIEYVDLRFTDPRGKLQHVTMDTKVVDDSMLNVGIFFDDIEQAVKAINRNHFNIDKWWNMSKRQEVLKVFKKKYVYFNDHSFDEDWLEYLLD